jgi:hypothetical protein
MDSTPCPHEHVRKAQGRYLCITCGSEVDNQNRSPIAPKLGAEIVAPPLVNSLFGLPIRGLKVLSITLPLAVLVLMTMPLAHLITYALGTLCHEMGHSTIAILTGHLAVPTFDLAQGGGLTHVFERQWWLLIALALVTAHTAFRYRESKIIRNLCGIGAGTSIFLILTGLDEPLHVEMGHGGQLVAGGIFLYRGLTGIAEIYPGERWLYGFLGWSLIYDVVDLCWSLTHDPVALARYFEGKSSCANDFVRLADYLGSSVEFISWVNLLFAFAVPLIVGGTFLLLRRYPNLSPWRNVGAK